MPDEFDEEEIAPEEVDAALRSLNLENRIQQKLFERKLEGLAQQLTKGEISYEEYSRKVEELALEGEEEGFM